MVDFTTAGSLMAFSQSEPGVTKVKGCTVPWSGATAVNELNRAARWIELCLCLTEAAE